MHITSINRASCSIYEPHLNSIQETDIDIMQVASKVFASGVLLVTNSILSVTVGVSKLTGFTILPTIILTNLTSKLYSGNTMLAQHGCTPLKKWAEYLEQVNAEMRDTHVLYIKDKKPYFSTQGYSKYAKPMKELLLSSLALSLWATSQVLFVVTKPAYLILIGPGLQCDEAITGLFYLSRQVSKLIPEYSRLNNLCEASFQSQKIFTKSAYQGTILQKPFFID